VNFDFILSLLYILSATLFIFGLKMLSSPASARKGNLISATGMVIAIVVTLLTKGLSFKLILIGAAIGGALGFASAYMIPMTAIPEMVSLMNGSGGIASLLVAWAEYHRYPNVDLFTTIVTYVSVVIGGISFAGSVVAWGKLSGRMPGKPIVFPGMKNLTIGLIALIILCGYSYCVDPINGSTFFIIIICASLILGVLGVFPVGGADMPVVISLLNSFTGLAACASGFILHNTILIVAGALVGASGAILTQLMCKAMNKTLPQVLFSGFKATSKKQTSEVKGEVKPISVKDAYLILEAASSVVFVPGYGMAVAQAQHVVRELAELLEKNGADVTFAIHPVAGRMPGHMNVLLAEANVSYDQLVEMDDINPLMESKDVAIVIGANDVVNPAARHDKSSPMYGMPIINVDKAKTVFVVKRSMAAGFSGVENELFFYDNVRMLFGDGKQVIQGLIAEFKG
jgi:H+-translocating NAD(P) transhydrogenase subunit beta